MHTIESVGGFFQLYEEAIHQQFLPALIIRCLKCCKRGQFFLLGRSFKGGYFSLGTLFRETGQMPKF